MSDYVPVEEETMFNPNIFSLFMGFIAFLISVTNWLIYAFALVIMVIPSLRPLYMNWAIISVIVGYGVSRLSRMISHNYGPTRLRFDHKAISIKHLLIKQQNFLYNDILHIEERKRDVLKFLPTQYEVYTTDNKVGINPIRWKNFQHLVNLVSEYAIQVDNIYVRNAYYKNSFKHSILTILRTTQGKIGILILLIYLGMASVGALAYLIDAPEGGSQFSWILWDPNYITYLAMNVGDIGVLEPPSSEFWFGTDFAGRDIFSRMIFGTMVTMLISTFAAFVVTIFISIFGISSAIYGGVWDNMITRLSDVLMTFPQVVWIILISVFSTPFRLNIPGGFFLAVYLGMSLVMWPLGARLVRAEVLEALDAEYVQAVELVGANRRWIIRKHVLPKVIPTIFLLYFYQLTDIIIGISLLGYLGFGSESTIVWGSDLAKAYLAENIQNEWWTVVFPSLFIFGIVMGLTLFSDALRDAYASRYRGGIQTTLHASIGGNK